ncbi:hypothetical protein [Actinacidiphila bryophytorum]|uniref:hypothetical protein n=1 Tax=Actinacidiphila bryophytorum TaxID=1436133 RepID=UPI002176993C|nr:hypothetical protein [Actinacidiphila bryophytorum]UWE11804.1 hypothetical protein NYE86_25935 [Actinacidiphila bryophytorum]
MYDAARATAQDGGAAPDAGRKPAPDVGAARPDVGTAPPDLGPVRDLVHLLAPQLGLDPGQVKVEATEAEQGGPLGGARAAAGEHGLLLRPSDMLDPEPALLAHELAHLAQHRNRTRPPSATLPTRPRAAADLTAAEAEAAAVADAARTGGALWRPRALLPDGVLARDTGASGIAPRTADQLAVELTERVAANHPDEIALLGELFSDVWSTAEDRVEAALTVLDGFGFVVARALVQCLRPPTRERLARISGGQYGAHPRSAAAVLSVLTTRQLTALRHDRVYDLPQALAGLAPGALGPAELRGVHGTLHRLFAEAPDVTADLFDGPARTVLRALISLPTPPGTDADLLTTALAEERRVSADRRQVYGTDGPVTDRTTASGTGTLLLRDLTARLASPGATAAREALDLLAGLVGGRGAQAAPAGPAAAVRLRLLVTELDARGLVDRLLDHLPAADRHDPDYSRVLSAVLSVRRPARTLARIESLLSYGLFDWAVTDEDARFAYLLVRSLPLAEQDAWRRLDGGKWYQRLEANLPAGMVTGGEYQGVGGEFTVAGPGATREAVAGLLKDVLVTWKARPGDGATAVSVVRRLLGLGPGGEEPPGGAPGVSRGLATAVVRRLDALGDLPDIVEALPETYLTAEASRHELLDLTALRDPVNVQRQAAALLRTGLFSFDWWVSAAEAWLAHQLLRALSTAEQDRFEADHPGAWASAMSAMTPRMLASAAVGALTGRGEFPSREQLRGQLRDQRLWKDPARRPVLRALLDLAYRSDDRRWVLDRIHAHRDLAGLEDLAQRIEEAGDIAVPGWGDELVAAASRGFRLLVAGGDLLLQVASTLPERTLRVELDVDDLREAVRGTLAGAEAARPALPGGNRISIELEPEAGALTVRLASLDLRQLNVSRPGASFHTGEVHIRGLEIRAGYSDRRYRTPVGVSARLASLDAQDVVAADPQLLPGGAAALARLLLTSLTLHAADVTGQALPAPQPGSIPVPLFGPLFQALENLVALTGGVPGAPSLLDLALLPYPSPVPSPLGLLTDRVVGHYDPTGSPVDYLWGLASEGGLRPPHSVEERTRDAIGRLRALEVTFAELSLTGLVLGGDQQVASVTFTDFGIGAARSLPGYLRLRQRALERTLKRTPAGPEHDRITAEIHDLEKQLVPLRVQEAQLESLESRDRLRPGSLNKDERKELARLSDLLRADAGLVMDIGSITIGALHGRVTAAGAEIGPVHTHVRAPSEALARFGLDARYLADPDLIARFQAGGTRFADARLLADPQRRPEFVFEAGPIRLLPGPPGQPALLVAATGIPPVDAIRARLASLPPDADPAVREHLARAVRLAEQIDTWHARQDPPAQELLEAEDELRGLLGYSADSVAIGAVSADPVTVTQGGEKTEVRAGLRVSGIRLTGVRGPGFSAAEVTGAVRMGARLADGTLTPEVSADLTAHGVHAGPGTFGTLGVTGLRGSLRRTADGYAVPDLAADRLEVADFAVGDQANGVTGRRAALVGVALDAEYHRAGTGQEYARIAELTVERIEGEGLGYHRTDAQGSLHASVESGALVGVRATDVMLTPGGDGWQLGSAGLTIGRVEDLRYEILAAAVTGGGRQAASTGGTPAPSTGGTSVRGTLTSAAGTGPVVTAHYARVGGDDHTLELAVAGLGIEQTTVRTPATGLVVTRTLLSGRVRSTARDTGLSLELTDTELRALSWHSGARKVTAPGPVTVGRVDLRDAVLTEPDPHAEDPARRARRLTVAQLTVRDIRAPRVHYTDPPVDLVLAGSAESGSAGPRIASVELRDAVLPFTPAGTPDTDAVAAQLDVRGASLPFVLSAGRLRDGLRAAGRIDVGSLSVRLRPGGPVTAHAAGVAGEVDLASGHTAGRGSGLHTWLTFGGLDSGEVTITPQAVEVADLRLPNLTLSALRLRSGAGSGYIAVDMTDGGGVDVSGVRVAARLERPRPGAAGPGQPAFTRVVLSRARVDRIAFEGLDAQFGAGAEPLYLSVPVVPGGAPATLTGLDLGGPGGFVWTPGGADPFLGTLHAERLSLPRLRVEATKAFRGDLTLTTDAIRLGLLRRGRSELDVDRLALRLLGSATLGSPQERISVGSAGAEHLHRADGTTRLTGVHADLLHYERPGVEIDVEHAKLPEAVTTLPDSRSMTVPRLDLGGAHLRIDFRALPPAAGRPDPLTMTPEPKALLDSLNGTLGVQAVLHDMAILPSGTIEHTEYRRDVVITTPVTLEGGEADTTDLAASLSAPGAIAFAPDSLLDLAVRHPQFDVQGSRLFLFVTIPLTFHGVGKNVRRNLLSWRLTTAADLDLARLRHRVRLRTLLDDMVQESDEATNDSDAQEKKVQAAKDAPTGIDLSINPGSGLSLHSREPIGLQLASQGVNGRIGLGSEPLSGLRLSGSLVLSARPGYSDLGKLAFQIADLTVPYVDLTVEGHRVSVGAIEIHDLHDASVSFDELRPRVLEATIRQATARNIEWSHPAE